MSQLRLLKTAIEGAPRSPPPRRLAGESRPKPLWLAVHLAGLAAVERSDQAARDHIEGLASRALRLTSTVCLEPPEALLAEIGGSVRLFGGIEPIRNTLARDPALQNRQAHFAVAPTALAALWLARAGGGRIDRMEALPGGLAAIGLGATRWPEAVRSLLRRMGIRTIGDCLKLPRDGFARRTGERCLLDLDRAIGKAPHPGAPFVPAASRAQRIEFSGAVTDAGRFFRAAEQMILELSRELRECQARIERFEIVFEHLRRPSTIECIALAEPADQPERLLRLVSDRLERIVLPAPVMAIGITVERTEPARAEHAALFCDRPGGAAAHPDSGTLTAAELLERLQGRFGNECVYRVGLVPEHRPERAWSKLKGPLLQTAAEVTTISPWAGCRPLWLLPSPRVLCGDEAAGTSYRRGALRLEAGPERIETGWWDGGDVARDYFFATTAQGQRLWIYRERSSRGRRIPRSSWYLHGVFA